LHGKLLRTEQKLATIDFSRHRGSAGTNDFELHGPLLAPTLSKGRSRSGQSRCEEQTCENFPILVMT
jgi:hypothetical protein